MKRLLFMLLWLSAMLGLAAGATFYLSNRCALFFPAVSQKTWLYGLVAVVVLQMLVFTVLAAVAHPIARPLSILGVMALAVFLFMILSVAVTDVFNLAFKFTPRTRGVVSAALAVLLTAYSMWHAYRLKVREIAIPIKGLTQEVRAVHITDLHLGSLLGRGHVDKIVRTIKQLKPDLLFNTGDMFDGKMHFAEGCDVLSSFRSLNVPHYFVSGNHDQMVGAQEVIKQMKGANATVLSNKVIRCGPLQIVGLDNMPADENAFEPHVRSSQETIKSVMARLPMEGSVPTVVLHHRPDGVEYMQERGADLLLAGHTHGGQIFPFTLVAKLMFKYNSGLYEHKTMSIFVSEGAVTVLRLGTSSEVVLLRLVPAQ